MKQYLILSLLTLAFIFTACAQKKQIEQLSDLPAVITNPAEYNELTDKEKRIILNKGTEYAFSGTFANYKESGIYICKQCNLPLFNSSAKFDSRSGWPSFDDMIENNVKEIPDADGSRTEIVCANCGGHLGHVFLGEGFTDKQTRHCANSASLNFVALQEEKKPVNKSVVPISEYVKGKGYEKYETAVFAGGCFWCTEASLDLINGTADVISGYSGGKKEYPTYEEIGRGSTNHAEAIIIYYDPEVISYEKLLEVFFVAHDPTQLNRQGPDLGKQYRSAIFYQNEEQKAFSEAYIKKLDDSGRFSDPIVTTLEPYTEFWVAEDYHQDYYYAHPESPYVQRVSKPKVEKVRKVFKDLLKNK